MRKIIWFLLATFAFVGLGGCATPPSGAIDPSQQQLFVDAAFKPTAIVIDPSRALAISPEMARFADTQIRSEMRVKGLRDGLIDALYTKGQLKLDYDGSDTRTASEAFRARQGNCLSLVLMTAAFAHYFDLPISFNSVVLEESWTRESGLFIVAGHVNITLTKPSTSLGHLVRGDDSMLTIDFLPREMLSNQRSRGISESTIIAMYLNNRAAETLTAGKVDDAYWWIKAAIETDPRWLPAYNTLAVLYQRKGMSDRAESTLRLVLDREPMNVQALSNLVIVLGSVGRQAEAVVYSGRLAQIQPVPPYYYFDEGVLAMKAGQFTTARNLFKREIARSAYVSEFYFWLALADYGLGDWDAARSELTRAKENSATIRDHDLYSAKLAWLKEQSRR